MSETTANHEPLTSEPTAITELLHGSEPMGDLSRFAISDLTPGEQDEFFQILEDARSGEFRGCR